MIGGMSANDPKRTPSEISTWLPLKVFGAGQAAIILLGGVAVAGPPCGARAAVWEID
jgi:hypothetical protein